MFFFYGLVPSPPNLQKNEVKWNFEHIHQILDSNNIEPPYTENHDHVPIITSFAFFACVGRFKVPI